MVYRPAFKTKKDSVMSRKIVIRVYCDWRTKVFPILFQRIEIEKQGDEQAGYAYEEKLEAQLITRF